VIGVLSGYFYTAEFAPRGVGEIIVGLNFGPLLVIGSFFVQTQIITYESIAASVPLGILILEVLWVNEIPDFDADARAGKKTLVTRIGRKKAADVYAGFVVFDLCCDVGADGSVAYACVRVDFFSHVAVGCKSRCGC